MDDENKPKISLVEKWLVVGATLVIDLIQVGVEALDLTGVGAIVSVIVNRLIDIITGLTLWLYCRLRGITLDWKRTASLLAAAFAELIPVIDVAPFWTLDAAYLLFSADAERVISKMPGGKQLAETVQKVDKAV